MKQARLAPFIASLQSGLAESFTSLDEPEKQRLRSHAIALLLVALGLALNVILGATAPFTLLHAAVVGAALAGGFPSASLALLTSILAARLISGVALWPVMMFAVEAAVLTTIVVQLRTRFTELQGRLTAADTELADLRVALEHARLAREAFTDLERASERHVAIVLTGDGLVSDWQAGAARLYLTGSQQAVGMSAGLLFYPELKGDDFAKALDQARTEGSVSWRGTHRRFDGTMFEAEVRLRYLVNRNGAAFSMLVHDLTDRQAAEAFARHAAERQHELHEEVTLAQQQLASLELVTDPYLNAVHGRDAINLLVNRLKTAVTADGVAVVRPAGFRPRMFWASDGIRPEPPTIALLPDDSDGRTVVIHNDPARVGDLSVAVWPADVRSMIAVPLIQNGQMHATMEVVYQRGPRSTDWEIALIQVAAARAASLLPGEPFAGTGAVA